MSLNFPFDPIKRSKETEAVVMQGEKRLYFRFRCSAHYGGIITGDSVGCNVCCAYCWNFQKNLNPVRGEFYSPAEVIAKLKAESMRSGYQLFRVSAGEPILGKRSAMHLAQVLRAFPGRFFVETNGLAIGRNP